VSGGVEEGEKSWRRHCGDGRDFQMLVVKRRLNVICLRLVEEIDDWICTLP